MTKKASRATGLAVMAAAAMALTACNCICPENQKAGLPVILCQPMDQQVATNQDALFKVKAKGENLSYKWFFQNSDVVLEAPDGLNSVLVVPGSRPDRAGKYWCVIQSDGKMGLQESQTRSASLTQTLSTNETQGSFTSSQGTNACCGTNCGFVNFNNSGLGFSLNAGQTFTIQLSLNASMSPLIDTMNWCARWRYGGQANQTGCFSVISSTQEQFTAPVTAKYAITVYIKNNCPPNGTTYYMSYQ